MRKNLPKNLLDMMRLEDGLYQSSLMQPHSAVAGKKALPEQGFHSFVDNDILRVRRARQYVFDLIRVNDHRCRPQQERKAKNISIALPRIRKESDPVMTKGDV